jgi:hypothetical protein
MAILGRKEKEKKIQSASKMRQRISLLLKICEKFNERGKEKHGSSDKNMAMNF